MFRSFLPWLLLATSAGWAQQSPPESPALTLPQAAQRTLERNPRLQSAGFSRESVAAEIDQAGLSPQWSIDLEVEDVLGTGTLSGLDSSQTTLRLSRIFEPSEVRSGRISVARATGNRLEADLESERLDLMALLADRFLEVVHQQEVESLAEQAMDVWTHTADLARTRERAGAASAVDRLRTEIRIAEARLSLEDAEHALRSARNSLAATWGDRTADFGQAAGALCEFSALPDFESLARQIERNPDIARFSTEQRLREAEGRLASARRKPQWSLSAGVRHLEGIGEQGFVVGVSVPLGQATRAEPQLRRASSLRQRSVLDEQDARTATRSTLFSLYQETLHSVTEAETIENDILPRARKILSYVEEGYVVGQFSYIDLVTAQTELLAARSARLSACADHHRFLIDIERLTGGGAIWLGTETGISP